MTFLLINTINSKIKFFKNKKVKISKVSIKKILATNYELLCNILDKKNRELKKMRLKNIFILYLRLKIISLKSL